MKLFLILIPALACAQAVTQPTAIVCIPDHKPQSRVVCTKLPVIQRRSALLRREIPFRAPYTKCVYHEGTPGAWKGLVFCNYE